MLVKGGTVCYAPSIKAYAATSDASPRYFDLTEDIVSCNVTRNLDGASSATITLQNSNDKYLDLFRPWDRVTIYANRDGTDMRLFTGYVTDCPSGGLQHDTVTLDCKCTIYRLEKLLWDADLIESQKILNIESVKLKSTMADGGAAFIAQMILERVAGVNPNYINIQKSIPPEIFKWAQDMYALQVNDIQAAEEMASALSELLVSVDSFVEDSYDGDPYIIGPYTGTLRFGNGGLPIPVFHQDDAAWSKEQWGRAHYNNIGNSGCGQTCFAMFATYWNYNRKPHITPSDVVKLCNEKFPTNLNPSIGTEWALWDKLFVEYGMSAPTVTNKWSVVKSALLNGQAVICSQNGNGWFANGGHFILLRGASGDGNQIYVNDPASYHWGNGWQENGHNTRTVERQMNEATGWFTPDEITAGAVRYWICPKRPVEPVQVQISEALDAAQSAADEITKTSGWQKQASIMSAIMSGQ